MAEAAAVVVVVPAALPEAAVAVAAVAVAAASVSEPGPQPRAPNWSMPLANVPTENDSNFLLSVWQRPLASDGSAGTR